MAKNRSRRLRKKLYVGEFTILGFEFTCTLSADKEGDYDSLMDDFIDFVEDRSLVIGGGMKSDTFSCFVTSGLRYGSATEQDRQAVDKWLNEHPICSEVTIGELVDANA